MRQELITLNKERNVTLTAYIQNVGGEFPRASKRPGVIVIPGGGYTFCSEREADPVAIEYLKCGYHAFILRYSVGEHAMWPNPLNDFEQAMDYIRSNADAFGLYADKIVAAGFSAGGHLAACAASLAKNKPNAAILGYAVTLEEMASWCSAGAPDASSAVGRTTCPCFVFATRTDAVVPVENSLRFINALNKYGIAFESHIYGFGPHGISTGNASVLDPSSACGRAPYWVKDSIGWLGDMFGDFEENRMTAPRCKPRMRGDYDETLSVYCTMAHIMQNAEARALLDSVMKGQAPPPPVGADAGEAAGPAGLSLIEAMKFAHVPDEVIMMLDEQLSKIKNI